MLGRPVSPVRSDEVLTKHDIPRPHPVLILEGAKDSIAVVTAFTGPVVAPTVAVFLEFEQAGLVQKKSKRPALTLSSSAQSEKLL